MLGHDSQCVRVLIPDDNVGYRGFHDVMLVDRTEEDAPYVAVSDLSALRQQWPDLVISGMTNRQLELEELRRMCKKKYCGARWGYVHSVEKLSGWIYFDMWHLSFGIRPALTMPSVMVYPMDGYTTGLY